MKHVKYWIIAIVLLFTGTIYDLPVKAEKMNIKDLSVEEEFAGTQGTIVLKNLKSDKIYVYNKERSEVRYTPESTFKVPNALIGLQTKAVNDEYEVKRWDGVVREFPEWNRDHTLASGMRHSVIWYYQQMARDIGFEQMQTYMKKIHFGNGDISGGIDHFWLDSTLKVSAQEQVQFMENLVEEKLPFGKQEMRTVKRIMINDEADSYVLHGKTGTRLADYGLGWYVGYIETDKADWVFATNVDGSGTKARNITMDVLEKLNIIEE